MNGKLENSDESGTTNTADTDLVIGYTEPGGTVRYYGGDMDEIVILKRALSSGEVKEIYNSQAPLFGKEQIE